MKIIAGFILSLSISTGAFCQTKKLNKLLAEHAYTFAEHPPLSVEDSKEIVVPGTYSVKIYTLLAMKWKDIDSIRVWDTGGANMRVYLYGKGTEYNVCENKNDTCTAVYFDSLYKKADAVDHILIEIESKGENGKQLITTKELKKLINLLKGLNNSKVIEDYPILNHAPIPIIEPPRKGIIVYLADHLGKVYIPAKEIQEIRELKTVLSTFKIVSFNCYIAALHSDAIIVNNGEKFNDELLRAIKRVRAGTFIIFDEILVENGQEKIEKATNFIIVAK